MHCNYIVKLVDSEQCTELTRQQCFGPASPDQHVDVIHVLPDLLDILPTGGHHATQQCYDRFQLHVLSCQPRACIAQLLESARVSDAQAAVASELPALICTYEAGINMAI